MIDVPESQSCDVPDAEMGRCLTRLRTNRLAAIFALVAATAFSACTAIPQSERAAPPVKLRAPPPRIVARPAVPAQIVQHPDDAMVAELDRIWRGFPGRTGISVTRIADARGTGWTTGKRLGELFPQQSVSKLWVSMAVLDKVDRGELTLDSPVTITVDDLAVFHQPIRDRILKEGTVRESVRSLIEQALTSSDNTANDSLLRTVGGPDVVRRFFASRAIASVRFGPGERALQSAAAGLTWKQDLALGRRFYAARDALPMETRRGALTRYLADPPDGAAPDAITAALARLARGELLSSESTRFMLGILAQTHSGPQRLKGGTPPGWTILHKTGTGQDLPPVSTGYNDVGIMIAPDGTRYAVAVMIGETTAGIPARMQMMQSVARTVARYHRM